MDFLPLLQETIVGSDIDFIELYINPEKNLESLDSLINLYSKIQISNQLLWRIMIKRYASALVLKDSSSCEKVKDSIASSWIDIIFACTAESIVDTEIVPEDTKTSSNDASSWKNKVKKPLITKETLYFIISILVFVVLLSLISYTFLSNRK